MGKTEQKAREGVSLGGKQLFRSDIDWSFADNPVEGLERAADEYRERVAKWIVEDSGRSGQAFGLDEVCDVVQEVFLDLARRVARWKRGELDPEKLPRNIRAYLRIVTERRVIDLIRLKTTQRKHIHQRIVEFEEFDYREERARWSGVFEGLTFGQVREIIHLIANGFTGHERRAVELFLAPLLTSELVGPVPVREIEKRTGLSRSAVRKCLAKARVDLKSHFGLD